MVLVKQEFTAVPALVVSGTEVLESTDERTKRASLARLALGYKELSLAVAETRPRLTLLDVEEGLREADVQIFDNKDVSRYKAKMREDSWRNGFWDETPISEYGEPIPEFVIDTALQVKQAIPEAEFSIEYFVHRNENDPFLSFKVPGVQRRFVVEVWDEPDFEAERH
ncbi:hypothetical protein KAR91_27495 [Candidatus Pacearchaeota archaeon]|nr:hypothetical protein [Candidatus Pacearchaeota archaeon]